MIKYHNPQAETSIPSLAYQLGINLKGSNNAKVALLANGFPDSENFLSHIAKVLTDLEPGLTVTIMNKGNASIPANDEILNDIQDNYQALITAYGH